MLTARSDGFKCRPYILLKNKRPIKEIVTKFKNTLHLCWAGSSFFNGDLTSEFLQKIVGSSMFGKRLLAWDSYRCHISDATKKQLKKLQIDTAVISGGCTKFIQAPDVYWNAPFKSKVRQFYENWMLHGEKSYIKSGNMRAPSMEVYLKWIVDAWDSLPKDLIIKLFKGCGLTNTLRIARSTVSGQTARLRLDRNFSSKRGPMPTLPVNVKLFNNSMLMRKVLKMTRTATKATCHLIFTSEFLITYQ